MILVGKGWTRFSVLTGCSGVFSASPLAHCLIVIPRFKPHSSNVFPWACRAVTFYLELRLGIVLFHRFSLCTPQELVLFGLYLISVVRTVLSIVFEEDPPRWICDEPLFHASFFSLARFFQLAFLRVVQRLPNFTRREDHLHNGCSRSWLVSRGRGAGRDHRFGP